MQTKAQLIAENFKMEVQTMCRQAATHTTTLHNKRIHNELATNHGVKQTSAFLYTTSRSTCYLFSIMFGTKTCS